MITPRFAGPRRALISVTDKTGIEKFGALTNAGWDIISTGNTAKYLATAHIPVMLVEEYTRFPEMMDGRLKTLHPRIHGGLLGALDNLEHVAKMVEHHMVPIDLLVVNLYDFEEKPCIGNIDIGGPAMIRSGAKNYNRVTVLTSPLDYDRVIADILSNGDTSLQTRRRLAEQAFHYVSRYDNNIGSWLGDCVDADCEQLQQA